MYLERFDENGKVSKVEPEELKGYLELKVIVTAYDPVIDIDYTFDL